ncbi:MAG TPA: GNAT family N-acetyltransferase [Allosphingosinicella sp.]|nr:GNAT family N-acetyltransferase [Allosphingosinicella sp.]
MFARTKRLTLRPGWPEDAAALSRAIGHEAVVTMLAQVPWPYARGDAEAFLARPRAVREVFLLILSHEGAYPRLVGGIGIQPEAGGGHELGYWLTPDAWGRGYATEAGQAMVAIARHALGLKRLVSGHFTDNPASGRVLRKLGFTPTGRTEARRCAARGAEVPCALFELELAGADEVPAAAMAA